MGFHVDLGEGIAIILWQVGYRKSPFSSSIGPSSVTGQVGCLHVKRRNLLPLHTLQAMLECV